MAPGYYESCAQRNPQRSESGIKYHAVNLANRHSAKVLIVVGVMFADGMVYYWSPNKSAETVEI